MAFAKAELARIQAIPDTQFEAYRKAQRTAIIAHHRKNNAFYRSLLKDSDTEDWSSLPILKKSDLQQPLAQRLSLGYNKKNCYINKTSGSSGHPFIFAKDKNCHALSWASFQDRYRWYNLDLNHSKQARFYGIPLDRLGYQKERLKDRLGRRYRFPIFDLSEPQLEKIIEKFTTTAFEYINGYTSSIVLFAKYLKQKEQVLRQRCPSLKGCIVTSEMLFDSDKKLLEHYLGVPVINEYGASELGLIAFQNKEEQFRLDSELLYVEIVNDQDEIVPAGTLGRIVITALYNKAHPFIRYDIGDIGALSVESTPKKPILEQLQGRTNDIARLPSGKVVPGLTFYYVTKSIIEEDGNVREFVIEQLALDHFKILYTASRPLTSQEKATITAATFTYLEKGLRISFEQVTQMDRSNRGKLKQFVSKI